MSNYKNRTEDFIKAHTPDLDASKVLDSLSMSIIESQRHRAIVIDGEINGDSDDGTSIRDVVMTIMTYVRQDEENNIPVEDRVPITLLIDSIGGDAYGTYLLTKIMEESKTPVNTVNIGEASSSAGIILAHGRKRYAFPGSRALVHSGSIGVYGNAEQAESAKKSIDKLRSRIED